MPLANAELDGMINVRTSDSEVYTVFESDLVDASSSAPADEAGPRSTDDRRPLDGPEVQP
jgi:hypothetical protein